MAISNMITQIILRITKLSQFKRKVYQKQHIFIRESTKNASNVKAKNNAFNFNNAKFVI